MNVCVASEYVCVCEGVRLCCARRCVRAYLDVCLSYPSSLFSLLYFILSASLSSPSVVHSSAPSLIFLPPSSLFMSPRFALSSFPLLSLSLAPTSDVSSLFCCQRAPSARRIFSQRNSSWVSPRYTFCVQVRISLPVSHFFYDHICM